MNRKSLKIGLPLALTGLLATGCAEKTDADYVGGNQVQAVQELRGLFRGDFQEICYQSQKPKRTQKEYEKHDAEFSRILAKRDFIRKRLVFSDEQRKKFSREIDCLVRESWTCYAPGGIACREPMP